MTSNQTPKYEIGQEVYIIKDNKIQKKKILHIEYEWKAGYNMLSEVKEEEKYRYFIGDSNLGDFSEIDVNLLYPTKEDIIKDLP